MIYIDVKKNLNSGEFLIELCIKLNIKKGEFLAIAGKSGSGKTTFLRILAGLEKAKGKIVLNNISWLDDKTALPTKNRKIGFVFQDYALFPNMSVQDNLLFVKKDKKFAQYLLEMTDLISLKDRYPNTLSGGQKQRVALCRAMMNKPEILLMDEPLSALDPTMRNKLQKEILDFHKEFGLTTIMVSHDPNEIYRLADRVVVFEKGKIIKEGIPRDVLLKTSGSQKFSFEGELLEIRKMDAIYVAVIAIGQQLVEVVISKHEAQNLKIGQSVRVSTKAFMPLVSS